MEEQRFSARRGIAQAMYSDCGTTFIRADAALKKMFIQSSQKHQRIAQILQRDCTRWEFNPPGAPHMEGKWEAVVKSVKFHLRRTIGETLLTTEEFTTLLTQIEAILNSRPLEPLSDDPEDVSALTPGHFLIGGPITTIPEPSLIDLAISRLSRWQLIQQRVQHFWAQWSAHYLQRQQAISKWHHPNNSVKGVHRAAHRRTLSTVQMATRQSNSFAPQQGCTHQGCYPEDRHNDTHSA
ncbi:uncharacterized protein LOC143907471 [Temnothorax americanus]|uniref:uncharacterized protein LOC143907471 n=1 Tax=Temnothorax americanus TaxID=1964332 RepID=UPI00406770DE